MSWSRFYGIILQPKVLYFLCINMFYFNFYIYFISLKNKTNYLSSFCTPTPVPSPSPSSHSLHIPLIPPHLLLRGSKEHCFGEDLRLNSLSTQLSNEMLSCESTSILCITKMFDTRTTVQKIQSRSFFICE